MSYNRITDAIDNIVIRNGGDYSEFYVGISNDAERRLFDEHKVNRKMEYGFIVRLSPMMLQERWRNTFWTWGVTEVQAVEMMIPHMSTVTR